MKKSQPHRGSTAAQDAISDDEHPVAVATIFDNGTHIIVDRFLTTKHTLRSMGEIQNIDLLFEYIILAAKVAQRFKLTSKYPVKALSFNLSLIDK